MKAVQDKILITLPDIPLKVNDAQCSMIKRFVSGDKVVIEIKNGSIYGVSMTALLLVTSNSRWHAQDRTSGFRRRILYVLTPRAAAQRDPFLLKKLKVGASGLINWALDMPDERARIGQAKCGSYQRTKRRGAGYLWHSGMVVYQGEIPPKE